MLFGYGKQSSMQNQKIWQESNKFFLKIFLALDIVLNVSISILFTIFVKSTFALGMSCPAISVLVLIVSIIITEINIKNILKNKN